MKQKLEIKPLSVNQLFRGRRFKSAIYKSFESEMLYSLKKSRDDLKGELVLDVVFGVSSKASDLDNLLKSFIDCLSKKYGFNDNQIYELIVRKEIVKKGKEFILFKLKSR